ncbi:hypothetical protein FALBO_10576 [Fusarium albosuccineum]|uniref:Zn(2)-C6 fungal-type domain-containing protein n=1 Tax=Fusarium albosuccineum TaxID=1237068 RepID=A0A8H4P7Z7_9HYPO|nr:hypothetical protein FALBO_10576 [Fusarium albosuccineum]
MSRLPKRKRNQLLKWRKQHNINEDAYGSLMSILDSPSPTAPACTACSYRKVKCKPDNAHPGSCVSCASIPILCLKMQLSDTRIFDKWAVPAYKEKLLWPNLSPCSDRQTFYVQHFSSGPQLQVQGFFFQPSDSEQITVYEKASSNWEYFYTPAIALASYSEPDWLDYITLCSRHCVMEQIENHPILRECSYGEYKLTGQALLLWGATQLLVKGWRLADVDGQAPRVLQNQLDAQLELYVVKMEEQLLDAIQQEIKSSRSNRSEVTYGD